MADATTVTFQEGDTTVVQLVDGDSTTVAVGDATSIVVELTGIPVPGEGGGGGVTLGQVNTAITTRLAAQNVGGVLSGDLLLPGFAVNMAEQSELDTVASNLTTEIARAQAAEAALQPLDTDLTAIAALTTTSFGRNLLALADAAAGRTALGLGTAATSASTAFETAGAAATAQAFAIQRANHTGTQAPSTITGTAVVDADPRLVGFHVIHDRTLGATSASETFDITGYSMIRATVLARVSAASAAVGLRATLNGDTGSNYSTSAGAAAAFLALGNVTGSVTNSDRGSTTELKLNTRTGHFTTGFAITVAMNSNSSVSPASAGPSPQVWLSTAALTSLELFPASSTFAAGSRFIIEAMA